MSNQKCKFCGSLPIEEYPQKLTVIEVLDRDPFSFTHQKEETNYYNLSGHIHPGYRINGMAREGITVPCFYSRCEV